MRVSSQARNKVIQPKTGSAPLCYSLSPRKPLESFIKKEKLHVCPALLLRQPRSCIGLSVNRYSRTRCPSARAPLPPDDVA